MFKDLISRIVASALVQAVLFSLGGGGAVVTTVISFVQGASPASLSLLGISASAMFLGMFAAYRHAHPTPEDEALTGRRREKIGYWRARIAGRTTLLNPTTSNWTLIIDSDWYRDLRPHLASDARKAFEAEYASRLVFGISGDWGRKILLDEVARLEREWGLV